MAKAWNYADLTLVDWLHRVPGRIFTHSGTDRNEGIAAGAADREAAMSSDASAGGPRR